MALIYVLVLSVLLFFTHLIEKIPALSVSSLSLFTLSLFALSFSTWIFSSSNSCCRFNEKQHFFFFINALFSRPSSSDLRFMIDSVHLSTEAFVPFRMSTVLTFSATENRYAVHIFVCSKMPLGNTATENNVEQWKLLSRQAKIRWKIAFRLDLNCFYIIFWRGIWIVTRYRHFQAEWVKHSHTSTHADRWIDNSSHYEMDRLATAIE